jgi:hypothetical protein
LQSLEEFVIQNFCRFSSPFLSQRTAAKVNGLNKMRKS